MDAISKPIIKLIKDNMQGLDEFAASLVDSTSKESRLLLNSPVVYIHDWKKANKHHVYVGETNNIVQRTKEHYDAGKKPENWQSQLENNDSNLYVIAHDHFNKSLTLDVENRLIDYMLACPEHVENYNGRGNPQDCYFTDNELDGIFTKIWHALGKQDSELFVNEDEIKKSAIFKASPLHKLYPAQKRAKELILSKVEAALKNNQRGQLIFVEGEAGTGKTVLMSSTFYDMYSEHIDNNTPLKCCLMVNHNEQLTVYQQIMKRLGYKETDIVYKPSSFIHKFTEEEPADVVFVDEAHLLLTQGNQGYSGKNQLLDIKKRAKVTVIMYDEWQNLSTEQYWTPEAIDELRQEAISKGQYVELKDQLRIHAKQVMDWINAITKDGIITKIPKDEMAYDIQIFATPMALEKAIKEKAKDSRYILSRLVATYDWEYNGVHRPKELYPDGDREYWEVNIDGWRRPWNYETERNLSTGEKKKIKQLAWAEQRHTMEEIGSTFTVQGFDLSYAGVILGPSVKYRDGKIVFDPKASWNKRAVQNRTLEDGSKKNFGEAFLQHEFKVLMTRGVSGLYIYACDEELRNALLEAAHSDEAKKEYKTIDEMFIPMVAEKQTPYGK